MTNYEKIKAMSVEEMAECFADIISTECIYCNKILCSGKSCKKCCKKCIKERLKSEVEEDG